MGATATSAMASMYELLSNSRLTGSPKAHKEGKLARFTTGHRCSLGFQVETPSTAPNPTAHESLRFCV